MDFTLIKQLNELENNDDTLISGGQRKTGMAEWKSLRDAPGFVIRYVHNLFDNKSLSDLTRSRPMHIDVVAAIEGKGPDMRIEINEIATYLRHNTKHSNIIRMSDKDVFGADRGALVVFYDVDGYTHMVVKKGPTEVILRWPSADTRPQVYAVSGTMTGPAARRQISHHVHEMWEKESENKARYYLDLANDGDPLTGTRFVVNPDSVYIFQELDEEEEPDKYIVQRNEVPPDLWNKFVYMARKHSQQR